MATNTRDLLIVLAALGACVPGGGGARAQDCAMTTARFVADGDVVHDQATGLVWSRCNLPRRFDAATGRCAGAAYVTDTLESARRAMPSLSRESQNDWRLPTVDEVRAVFAASCTRAQQDRSPFGELDGVPIWTSSTDATGKVWKLVRDGRDGRPEFYLETTGAATFVGVRNRTR